MTRTLIIGAVALVALCFASSSSFGEQRGKRPGGEKPPGGAWQENKKPAGNQSHDRGKEPEGQHKAPQSPGAAEHPKNKATQGAGPAEAEHGKGKPPQGAAAAEGQRGKGKPPQGAGAAEAERNKGKSPQGAAAAEAERGKNNVPRPAGADRVGAGEAVSNRNQPKASNAEAASVGAAAANRRQPGLTGAQGAAVGADVADHHDPAATGIDAAAVRDAYHHPNVYSPGWYASNPAAWTAPGWAAGTAWTAANAANIASYAGYANSPPISYNYGDNVVNQGSNVIVNGNDVGSAEDFSHQAADLAWSGHTADVSGTTDWLSLGVFAVVRDESQHPHITLQLAVNSQGILRGNYTDSLTDHTLPVYGAIDKDSQRAAWTIGQNQNSFMEAGANNLSQDEAPMLLHKQGRTEQWLLVRLPQPNSGDDTAAQDDQPN